MNQRNRELDVNPPPPPPPPPQRHAVYVEDLFRRPDDRPAAVAGRGGAPLLCRAVTFGFLIFLVTGSISIVMWLIFHPVFPQLNVAAATFSGVSIAAGGTATADCGLTFLITNHNRHLSAIYDRMQVSLLYPSKQVILSQYYPPEFVQPMKNHTSLVVNLGFYGINLEREVAEAMKQDLDEGSLSLAVKVMALVRFKRGKWKTKTQYMRAYCGGVSFGFVSSDRPGLFLNPYQECEVYLYSK